MKDKCERPWAMWSVMSDQTRTLQTAESGGILFTLSGHIETAMPVLGIFVSLTGNFNITASDHMKNLKNIAFVGNTEHIQDSAVNSILVYEPGDFKHCASYGCAFRQ